MFANWRIDPSIMIPCSALRDACPCPHYPITSQNLRISANFAVQYESNPFVSKCGIITLDAMCNIHTVKDIATDGANEGLRKTSQRGFVDRKPACTSEFPGDTPPFMVDVVQAGRRLSLFDVFRVQRSDAANQLTRCQPG